LRLGVPYFCFVVFEARPSLEKEKGQKGVLCRMEEERAQELYTVGSCPAQTQL